jgi:chromosome segregation protein
VNAQVLHLKRVEIQGFKSFCDRTEMKFAGQGIAAIVGPNGCGKSNLSDAISWVLGEQSAKSLRGGRMEDVIFAGTRDRKPLGLAQVTMTLVDPDYVAEDPVVDPAIAKTPEADGVNGNGHHHEIPAAPPARPREITITRRLFRNGESEYLINGRSARLRDIQDIFLGTGLGPESYAIIEQGRIGQILSTKPADRRAVIEEAAGVTKFKTRRRLAEAKLEGAKQNLNRVFDILEEVGRQATSLKRQAQKAERYQALRKDYVAALEMALAGRHQILERDAAKTALELNAATAELQSLTEQVAAADAAQSALRAQCFATEAELTEARRRLAELRLEAERTRGRLENQTQQVHDIDGRLLQGEAEARAAEDRIGERQRELEAAAAQAAELTAAVHEARAALEAKGRQRDALQTELQQREREIEASRRRVFDLLGQASALRNQMAQTEGHLASIQRDRARIQTDAQAAEADLARLEALKASLAERLAARQMELESLGAQRQSVEAQLADRRERARQTREAIDRHRAEVSRMQARKDSLEEILSHRAYTTDSVKRLFTAIGQGHAEGLRPAGVLADFIEVDPQYEKAAEEFLHEELEYVVVENFDDARRGIELMRGDLDGRATFLVHPEADSRIERGRVAEPQDLPRLTDVLRLTNGFAGAPAELLPRLSRCFLAKNAETAERLALEFPDVFFLLPDGVCYHGYAVSGGKKTGSGPLALKRELRELTGVAQQAQTALEAAVAMNAALEAEIAALAAELERLRGLQQAQEKDALALDHESRKLAEEHQRASSRLSVARLDLQRLERDFARLTGEQAEGAAALAACEEEKQRVEASLEQIREQLAGRQEAFRHLAEEHSSMRASLAGVEERLRSVASAEQRLQAQVRELHELQAKLAAEMERLGLTRQTLLRDNIALDARAAELGTAIAELESLVAGLAEREAQEKTALAEGDETLRSLRASAQQALEARTQIELDLVRKQSDLKHLDETCQNQLDRTIAEVAAGVGTTLDEVALAEIEDKVRDLSRRIDALGPVNPQALEEYEEAQKRYDFLNAQRQDLLDSIRDTEKAIQEIDAESKRRFHEAFEKINDNFREMFKTLFNGGLGEMRLTDAENAAGTGIDIVAQPPGKKLQNVLLLSGGERAMTAMALLMAIFKYQPSPFCILDEVDAPLDEPNIQRLTRLLKEMATQTQFIVITHAKRTMEAAEAMYGVTMQEPGVSKLVSVKFQESGRTVSAAA